MPVGSTTRIARSAENLLAAVVTNRRVAPKGRSPGKAPGPGRERGSRFRCLGLIQLNVGTPENDSLIWAPHACPASVALNPSNASGSSTGSKSTSIRHDPLRPSSVAH